MSIECLNPAYEKIKNSIVYNKLADKKESLSQMLLYRSPYVEGSENIFEKAREFYFSKDRGISEKSKIFEDIIELEGDIENKSYFSFNDFEKVLLNHPCFLSYVVLGDEIFDYKKFKFTNLRSLSESITSFCVGERLFGEEYVWRSGKFKNNISKNIHGDLYAVQDDVSGKSSLEKTLFDDEEIFDIYAEVQGSGVSAYQDWSQFLTANLKYAEYLGKEKMREIVKWEDVLEDAGGGVLTFSTEDLFGTDFSEYDLKFLMDFPVIQDGMKLERFPLYLYSQGKVCSYPYFHNGNLIYLREDESGDISMEDFSYVYKDKKFSKVLEYTEEDLPHILTATYKYFARDRSKMYKIMKWFNEIYK